MHYQVHINTKSKKVIFETYSNRQKIVDWEKFNSLEELKRQDFFRKTDWLFNFSSTSYYIRLVSNTGDSNLELPPLSEVKKQVKKCSNLFELGELFQAVRNRLGGGYIRLEDWHYECWRYTYDNEDKDIKSLYNAIYTRCSVLIKKRDDFFEKAGHRRLANYLEQ